MVTYLHHGLYFTNEQVEQARKHRTREPLQSAWTRLLEDRPTEVLAAAQWDALRWRFNDDAAAGENAVMGLLRLDIYQTPVTPFDTLAAALALAQTFELLRDHPALTPTAQADWLAAFGARIADFNGAASELAFVETLWLGALNIAGGIVLERDEWLLAGAALYRETIEHEVRPEGYLPRAVEGGGDTLAQQFLAVAALALMAEMAGHAGVDLWRYTARGVSVLTACAYPVFYYYYPEKWRWERQEAISVSSLFRQHGGFLEMVNWQAQPKDMQLLLKELRPLYDLTGGGLTTLSHGLRARRGLFG